jgi:hypothetical protein
LKCGLLLLTPQVVPRGVFSDIPKLKSCDLSHNSMKALPDDIAALRCVAAIACTVSNTMAAASHTLRAGARVPAGSCSPSCCSTTA